MKRVRNFEIDLPWQIRGVVLGISIILSTLIVALGWQLLGSAMNALTQGIGGNAGDATTPFFSLANMWPWLLVVHLITTVRIYLFIKGTLVRRIASL
jgi:hypothetical protein